MSLPSDSRNSSLNLLERATFLHVALFFVATTWAFGGNGLWLRPPLASLGSVSLVITIAAVFGAKRFQVDLRPLRWLWPFALFNLLVLVSLFTPGFRVMNFDAETMFVPRNISRWIPSAAVPTEAGNALWLFDAIYLSCFNLALVLRRRRTVRGFLLVAMVNALALAVFGTVQKLANSDGIFFGAIKPHQIFFFSSFIYHNHWAAFALLMAAVCLGLAARYAQRAGERGFWHSPGSGALLVVLLLAATEPLSASRSGTILMVVLLLGAFWHWISRLVRRKRREHLPAAPTVAWACTAIAIAAVGIWSIAGDTILARVSLTEQQVTVMRNEGSIGGRIVLYRDTWHMAKDRPWFGWGMASYPYMFMIYNTQAPNRIDHLPIFYSAAHDDWLQSLAEHGFIGTALLGCCALVPLLGLRKSQLRAPLPAYLLGGCGLIMLYAFIEFPLGNIAVVLTWWLCYFCGVRYAALQEPSPDRAKT